MRKVLFSAIFLAGLAGWFGITSQSAFASFSECPATGSATACDGLITVGPGGSLTLAIDPSQAPVDGIDDTLLGVMNNSGKSLSSLFVNFGGSSQIFPNLPNGNVDGAFNYGGNGYYGPITTFSGINSSFTAGTLLFSTALANGSSTYFEVEAAPSAFGGGGSLTSTPEPSTWLLFGTGMALMGMIMLRNRKGLLHKV